LESSSASSRNRFLQEFAPPLPWEKAKANFGILTFQVAAIFLLTKRLDPPAQPEEEVEKFRELHSAEEEEKQPVHREDQQQEYDDVVREMLQVHFLRKIFLAIHECLNPPPPLPPFSVLARG